jgi:hypothetical protein
LSSVEEVDLKKHIEEVNEVDYVEPEEQPI